MVAEAGAPLEALLDDLAAEQAFLDELLDGLPAERWTTPSAAEGWDVIDQVGHLAVGEDLATLAASDPAAFGEKLGEMLGMLDVLAGKDPEVRAKSPAELLAWWRGARANTIAALRGRDPGDKIPWGGPAMTAISFARARLMETFAHGQDVRDGLGLPVVPTNRLRHVAALGVRTRGFSYTLRGLPVPAEEVRVELDLPDGSRESWGPEDASDRVAGPVEDFCLVVTRRRRPDETRLAITGEGAAGWMAIAQCYLGPPAAA